MPDNETKRPLVTFAVLSYNQERFIEEAVRAALDQDYPNLEIIISDDCSTDKTFEYARKIVERFGGARDVVLNRNEENLGLISHVNKVNDISNGELIVIAAGDDISFPNRTTRIVEEWKLHPNCKSFHSSVVKIDEDGNKGSVWKTTRAGTASIADFIERDIVIGATQAWSRELHDYFGPIRSLNAREDRIIATRAALKSGVRFVDEPLVFYRTTGISHNNYGVSSENRAATEAQLMINELAQGVSDAFKVFGNDPIMLSKIERFASNGLIRVFDRVNRSRRFRTYVYLAGTTVLQYGKFLSKSLLRRVVRQTNL